MGSENKCEIYPKGCPFRGLSEYTEIVELLGQIARMDSEGRDPVVLNLQQNTRFEIERQINDLQMSLLKLGFQACNPCLVNPVN